MSYLIWLRPGPKANMSERKAAMSAGQQFIKDKGYSNKTQVKVTCASTWIVRKSSILFPHGDKKMQLFNRSLKSLSDPFPSQIQVLPAGAETTLFKQFFSDWRDKDETTGPSKAYTIGSIAKVEQVPFDASTLHSNKVMAAQHGMVDDGKGKVQVGDEDF